MRTTDPSAHLVFARPFDASHAGEGLVRDRSEAFPAEWSFDCLRPVRMDVAGIPETCVVLPSFEQPRKLSIEAPLTHRIPGNCARRPGVVSSFVEGSHRNRPWRATRRCAVN